MPITEQYWMFPWQDITFIHLCLIGFQRGGAGSVLPSSGFGANCVCFWGSTCAHLQPLHASLAQEHSARLTSCNVQAHDIQGQCRFKVGVQADDTHYGMKSLTVLLNVCTQLTHAAATELLYCVCSKLNGSYFSLRLACCSRCELPLRISTFLLHGFNP